VQAMGGVVTLFSNSGGFGFDFDGVLGLELI
jgi:hypothetical protein